MKLLSKSPLFILVTFSLMTNSWASVGPSQLPDDTSREITEGKIAAAEADQQVKKELRKAVDEKQLKAIQLINAVGTYANDRFASDLEKDEAGHAYGGFIARFQGIREDRESLERKEIVADYKTLQNYSQRLDQLITEIKTFLK